MGVFCFENGREWEETHRRFGEELSALRVAVTSLKTHKIALCLSIPSAHLSVLY